VYCSASFLAHPRQDDSCAELKKFSLDSPLDLREGFRTCCNPILTKTSAFVCKVVMAWPEYADQSTPGMVKFLFWFCIVACTGRVVMTEWHFPGSAARAMFHIGGATACILMLGVGLVAYSIPNNDHPCNLLASCNTISCISASILWQGYVFMFVALALFPCLIIRELYHQRHLVKYRLYMITYWMRTKVRVREEQRATPPYVTSLPPASTPFLTL